MNLDGPPLPVVPVVSVVKTMSDNWTTVLDQAAVARCLERMAHAIAAEANDGGIALVGVRTRGVPIANRLAALYKGFRGEDLPIGELDIALYRDDFGGGNSTADFPEVRESRIPFSIAGRTVILVDDVLYTGRTVRAALNALMDYGRPRAVRLACLVDRGRRELPVQPDIVGYVLETKPDDHVRVLLAETDGRDAVLVEERRLVPRHDLPVPTGPPEDGAPGGFR